MNRNYDGWRFLDSGDCNAIFVETTVTFGNLSSHFLHSPALLQYSTHRTAFKELVRFSEGDRRTSRECRQESGTARPVGKLSQKLAHFQSTFGECFGRCIHYSGVRHLHVDRRYRALHTSVKLTI